MRQLLAESLLVSAAGGVIGLSVADWIAEVLLALTLPSVPSNQVLDGPVIALTLVLIILAALLSGIVPALRLTRTDQIAGMSNSLRTRGGDRTSRASGALIVSQVALSVVLLIPAALLVRSVQQLARVDLGFDPSRLIVMSLYPTLAGYEGARELTLYQQLLDRLNTVPGVEVALLAILRSAARSNPWPGDPWRSRHRRPRGPVRP